MSSRAVQRIVQVVPQTRSTNDGVSAFAAALAERFSRDGVVSELSEAFAAREESPSDLLRQAPALRRLDPQDAVLVHYVGYGYHPRAVPRGLVRVVEGLCSTQGACRVGAIFHEVYASGPPWRSSFWLLPLQRKIARQLLRLAGSASTSLPIYRELLRRLAREREVELLPIPSTVGEPTTVPDWAERRDSLVVFGTSGVRERAYRQEREALAAAIVATGVDEVIDIGDGEVAPTELAGVPVRRRGRLAPEEVGRALLAARFGFLAYPPDFLDKSTIFAAFVAHGLAPLVAWRGPRGREPGAGEFWARATPGGLGIGALDLAHVARGARAGYARRALARHAAFWQQKLGPR